VERSSEESAGLLRSVGLRVTATRLAVLEALARRSHADTDTVIGEVRGVLGAVSPQAVYNVLAAFVDTGIARRIEPAGSAALYELRVADNHHHVVCRTCGAVRDVDCALGRRPCLTPSDTHGYVLDEAEVTYWGLCPACQTTPCQTTPSAPSPAFPTTGPDRPSRSATVRRKAAFDPRAVPTREEDRRVRE
jgi:Fur family ferric uptake transcriptional regulator